MTDITPTTEQQQILDLGLDTVRVSAGAGTGKTTTVALMIANLISTHGIEPENILGITFTNKAASELADRVRSYLGTDVDPGREVEVHTYHGFAGQILSEFGLLAGLDRRPEVITPTFARQILGEAFYNSDFEHVDITWPGRINRIKHLGDRLGDHLLEPADLIDAPHSGEEPWPERLDMLEILKTYQSTKSDLSVVDYSDLITLSTRLVREKAEIARTIRDRYRVVVLDEYQDTNPAQRVLLTSIFGDGFPVVAVGDVDQTIYEWRGASAENFDNFVSHFSRPDGTDPHARELTGNYRSGQKILDVANEIRKQANVSASDLVSPGRYDGTVETHWAEDAMAEAEWVARRFEKLHDGGAAWSDMAVLFRKNKDFPLLVETMSRHNIPIEVANLGGLFSVPEVAELRSWLSLLARPDSTAAVLQILFGSRYRLGLADIAPVSRWMARSLDKYRDEDLPMTLVEGLEHLDEIEGVSPEVAERYRHFLDIYLDLLVESQGASLVETARLVLDRTRAWADVESLPPVQRLTARLNLYRFLDLTEDWSPLRGRSSLPAFLDYLEAMKEEPAEELDAARLSGEDAVTLVTVHRAKGLEWEIVAIPAVTEGNFPGKSQMYPDPATKADILPIEFRVDERYNDLPTDPKERTAYFRSENLMQEWRVAYVAATRAKSHLMVSGAHWYGHPEPNQNPKDPSPFFELVRSHPNSTDTGFAATPPRPEILRHEEGASSPDPVFESGWIEALAGEISGQAPVAATAEKLGIETAHDREVDMWSQRLFELPEQLNLEETPQEQTFSVTGLVTYAGCPKQFFWSEIDRLPRRRNPAAVAGTEVHRRIELIQKGNIPFDEISREIYDVPDTDTGPGAYQTFLDSRFGKAAAARVEAPFTLSMEGLFNIRGRIDAIYADDGALEVVDFKSGRPSNDPARLVQLEAYAVACDVIDFEVGETDSMQVTFAYLGGGLTEESYQVDEQWLTSARAHLVDLGSGILEAEFEPTPSDRCNRCDFLQFCEPGRDFIAAK
ncbi:MAG: ATP-dependent DNA helicase [Acidimicrobiia bacterium]